MKSVSSLQLRPKLLAYVISESMKEASEWIANVALWWKSGILDNLWGGLVTSGGQFCIILRNIPAYDGATDGACARKTGKLLTLEAGGGPGLHAQ